MLLPLPRIAAIPADFTVDPELSARFRRRVYVMNCSIVGCVALLPATLFLPIHGVTLGCLISFFPGMMLLTQTLRCPKCHTQPGCRVSVSKVTCACMKCGTRTHTHIAFDPFASPWNPEA